MCEMCFSAVRADRPTVLGGRLLAGCHMIDIRAQAYLNEPRLIVYLVCECSDQSQLLHTKIPPDQIKCSDFLSASRPAGYSVTQFPLQRVCIFLCE